ncbi:FAD-dependent oxidoreductase domain-containing protein 2 [Pleurodeles waltl]|uniref:FAD-dependent oxidoreductase domain-containing protein 2 n=1 Tax=Pleurodeles waltl TaxID=8319 RepID=UPI003709BE54
MPFCRGLMMLLVPFALAPVYADTSHHDYCIIGAGPSGLQAAYFLQQSQRDYIVFERANVSGSFFLNYPRHRKLISINKRHTGRHNSEFNLRHDWNSLLSHDERLLFTRYSQDYFPHADEMVRYLQDFSAGLRVRHNTHITHVRLHKDPAAWNGHYFDLTNQDEQHYRCSVLLVATGLGIPHQVPFPGSEYAEGYESVSVDPKDFAGQTVLVLGRGNAAFETADNILGVTNFLHMLGRSRVRLSWATHYVGDLRAINNGLLDTYQLKSLDGLLEGDLENLALVRDTTGRLHVSHKRYLERDPQAFPQDELDNFAAREAYDRVIRCLGWDFDFSIFDKTVRLVSGTGRRKKYPLLKPSYEARSTAGLYVLGTASHSIDFRRSAGGFIHGFRYTVRALHRLLEHRYHGVSWPATHYPITQLITAILRRVNEASGLYQMFEVLGDVVLLRNESLQFEYLEEYPLGVLPELKAITGREVEEGLGLFVITMEYGKNFSGPEKDVFYYNRAVGDAQEAWQSNFLHPVVYYYRSLPTEKQMKLRPENWPLPRPDAIHHVVEDFLTDWTAPLSHILPLRRFLENCLDTDLRSFFAESCFLFALTRRKQPPFCQLGYLKMQGLLGNEHLWRHAVEAGLMQNYTAPSPETPQNDARMWDWVTDQSSTNPGNHVNQASAKDEL